MTAIGRRSFFASLPALFVRPNANPPTVEIEQLRERVVFLECCNACLAETIINLRRVDDEHRQFAAAIERWRREFA